MNLRVLLLCVLAALLVSVPATAAPDNLYQGELPLGEPGLKETRAIEEVAPGVTLHQDLARRTVRERLLHR